MDEEGSRPCSGGYCAGVSAIVSSFLWLGASVLGVLADTDGKCFNDLRFAIFKNKSHEVYESWPTDLTPPKWSFAIWEFLYTWNMLWVVYCIATMCRTDKEGEECCTRVFPAKLHVVWWILSLTHLGWMVLWDRQAIVASLFVQGFVFAACVVCLVISHTRTYRCGALLQYKHPWDLWVARTLLQNGVIAMATWSAFVFVINAVVLLSYQGHLAMHLTSTVAIATYGVLALLFFVLETTLLDRWLRYSFAQYPVLAWVAGGILARHFAMWQPVTVAATALLALATLSLVVRVPVVVWRNYTDPLYAEQTMPKELHTPDDVIKRGDVTTIL